MGDHFIARRDFLKSTVAGFSGFFFLAAEEKNLEKRMVERRPARKKIIYRTLGNTGIKLPVVNMGVMNSDNPDLVRAALNSGVVLLDTAQTYQRGTNEAMIGEVLKERPRDSYVIATKARLPVNQNTGIYTEEATEEAYQHKIDTSLKNLKLDHVDIYYHHNVWVRQSALYEPILKALEKAKQAGKTRFVGISTHKNEAEVIQAAIDSKFYDVVLTTYNFKQKHYKEVRQAIAKAAAAGLGVVVMKALGGRQLQESAEKPIDAAAAIKWVLQDPHVHTIIPGFTTFEQMNLDLSVMEDPALTRSEKAQLEWAASQVGLYCQGCGHCLHQCRQNLPIPDLMRAYMYGYGYRNLREAQELVSSLNLPAETCPEGCGCVVACSSGFEVAERIRKIVRLRDVPADFIA
jgi:predicted aldo/keto reductase-like oxidoreductase